MDWFKDNYNSIIITLIGGLIFFILYIIYDLGSKLSLIFSSDKKKTKKEFEKIIGILIDCYYLFVYCFLLIS